MKPELTPGLLVLQGDRLETLAQAVFAWLARHPLGALEEEVLLVQSSGMGEWLKMELATAHGICAATRVELPARFFWRACRAVLGRQAVLALSPLDKQPLAWRLMRLLPQLAGNGVEAGEFAPVAAWLQGGDAARRWQLAQRLADLFDQYQVHRADWLDDWAAGHDRLRAAPPERSPSPAPSVLPPSPAGPPQPVPHDQRWQPALWRALRAELSPAERDSARPALQRRFLQALQGPGPWPALPRRVVLFGSTHLPQSLLQAIAAMGAHCQVLLAVPNPCRWFWADLIDGRESLPAAPRRHALRGGRDLSQLAPAALHAHGHPLLAAWGRQARDFVRQLDAFDDAERARERFGLPRVDLFTDETEADQGPWLAQVQAHIRELRPLAEHTHPALAADDRSIVFHVCHSALREVEVLHDQLLHLLVQSPTSQPGAQSDAEPGAQSSAQPDAQPDAPPLAPRDIVVMVPDIANFAPAIRAVFGQHARHDPRHIPWGIADLRERGHRPLLVVLEWLLHAPQPRCTASELRDLLDLPALARRFGLATDDLPTLLGWIDAAGARWGLHAAHRDALGLGACGDVNTWQFALRRMLLGHAAGALPDGFEGIEPCAEVAGLSAGLVGVLAELLDVLQAWWADAVHPRHPGAWAERLRSLLAALFSANDDIDRALLAALHEALAAWLLACEQAGFDEPLPLAVVREAWLDAVDAPDAAAALKRFRAGGVTFCTLLPLRAVPFEVVCLLGMNDGDYPRRAPRSDFDLMAGPGLARPGDRSRRDDDRQLMLDALLSARRVLYLSWAGRSMRDNQVQPPSVLVGQLRDYLTTGWSEAEVAQRTTEHPLQPFSRRYFEQADADVAVGVTAPPLFTYASEWRAAHADIGGDGPATQSQAPPHESLQQTPPAAAAAPIRLLPAAPMTVDSLSRFLRNPVQAFFRQRLRVAFDDVVEAPADDEAFDVAGLDRWQRLDELLRGTRSRLDAPVDARLVARLVAQSDVAAFAVTPALSVALGAAAESLRRAGRMPLGAPGRHVQVALVATALPMLQHWEQWHGQHPQPRPRLGWRQTHAQRSVLVFDDVLPRLQARCDDAAEAWWIELQPVALRSRERRHIRPERLPFAWLRSLMAAAAGRAVGGVLIGTDGVITVSPLPVDGAEAARALLDDLLAASDDGLNADAPLPTALGTGLAALDEKGQPAKVYDGGTRWRGEGREACLARLFPDFAALAAEPGFLPASQRLYAPFAAWIERHVSVADLPGAKVDEQAEGEAEAASGGDENDDE